jgi:hypothetical protein
MSARRALSWTALAIAAGVMAGDAGAQSLPSLELPSITALAARRAIVDFDYVRAAQILGVDRGADESLDVAVERARLALYRGDCDAALRALQRPDLEDHADGAELVAVATGCARATAGTVMIRDEGHDVVVRLQDDADRVLVPLLAPTAVRIREMLSRELGARLPSPLFVDLVRDQLALAAVTGLPEQAAQTTGTVAVARWGRVVMVSPRAAQNGYPWLDTLAHEMTHLALAQATLDRAPLWLQEGVAKRQETRWREPDPFDGRPSADAVAAAGIQRGLGLPLAGLGPSIAMLPTPQQARVAFAEVTSFVMWWTAQAGEGSLLALVRELRDGLGAGGELVSAALAKVSGATLAEWEGRWRAQLLSRAPDLAPELVPGNPPPNVVEVARRRRLGQLLLGAGHAAAARSTLARAHRLLPTETSVRCLYAEALLGSGEITLASDVVARPADIHQPSGRWWSLHALLLVGDALPRARANAVALDPYQPAVACQEWPLGDPPADPIGRALCDEALALSWLGTGAR